LFKICQKIFEADVRRVRWFAGLDGNLYTRARRRSPYGFTKVCQRTTRCRERVRLPVVVRMRLLAVAIKSLEDDASQTLLLDLLGRAWAVAKICCASETSERCAEPPNLESFGPRCFDTVSSGGHARQRTH
jgi:hypothetical protein